MVTCGKKKYKDNIETIESSMTPKIIADINVRNRFNGQEINSNNILFQTHINFKSWTKFLLCNLANHSHSFSANKSWTNTLKIFYPL